MKKEMEQAKNDEEFIKRTNECQKEFDRSSSIESLNKLYDKYSCDDEFLEDDKLFSIILKDLEVLEIIKELCNFEIYYTRDKKTITLEIISSDYELAAYKGEKEYKQIEKIKEWLENE